MKQIASPLEVLQQYWGHAAFRPLQEDIIGSALAGRDTLALLPTGGGKSICFQVPALCQEGICIVVSPLIALMKDQVSNLQKRNIPAVAIYSGMNKRQIDILFENACNGAYKFLYISPERLKTDMAKVRVQRMNVNLLAIDEAHCVSQWGYDFRPPYLEIAEFRKLIPKTPVIALTATATPEVMVDICEKLEFKAPNTFQQSFSRTNLSYSVLYETQKREKLVNILTRVPGSGIVYVRSRGETKEVAHLLQQNRVSADFYHAGLSAEDRSDKQDAWMNGKTRIIVCTNAFGMGIDKPDVRIVVHLGLPESLEAYFQEAGRAGRDGKKAFATMLYTTADGEALRHFMKMSFPPIGILKQTYQAIGSSTQLAIGAGLGESFDFDFQHFCNTYKLDFPLTHAAIKLLEQEGWIMLTDSVSSPAKVIVTADRETLYDYQIKNKQADSIIKVLLRAYPGIQNNITDISENMIAQYAKCTIEQVQQSLQSAYKENILQYELKKDKPQLIFTRARVGAENLTIDQVKFNFRKERAQKRVDSAIIYAERLLCRSGLLLDYFGEKDSPPCGICDICTGRNKSDIPTAEIFNTYERKLREVLRLEPLTMKEILEAFAIKRHSLVIDTVSYLCDEGRLKEVAMIDIRFLKRITQRNRRQ